MKRHAGGLRLDQEAVALAGDGAQLGLETMTQPLRVRGQRRREVEVVLAAVAAHQVHVFGQAGQPREVGQRPPGDDRHVRLRQGREGAKGDDSFAAWTRPRRIRHDGRDRPVVVGGDEEHGDACDPVQMPSEVPHVARASRNELAQ